MCAVLSPVSVLCHPFACRSFVDNERWKCSALIDFAKEKKLRPISHSQRPTTWFATRYISFIHVLYKFTVKFSIKLSADMEIFSRAEQAELTKSLIETYFSNLREAWLRAFNLKYCFFFISTFNFRWTWFCSRHSPSLFYFKKIFFLSQLH